MCELEKMEYVEGAGVKALSEIGATQIEEGDGGVGILKRRQLKQSFSHQCEIFFKV